MNEERRGKVSIELWIKFLKFCCLHNTNTAAVGGYTFEFRAKNNLYIVMCDNNNHRWDHHLRVLCKTIQSTHVTLFNVWSYALSFFSGTKYCRKTPFKLPPYKKIDFHSLLSVEAVSSFNTFNIYPLLRILAVFFVLRNLNLHRFTPHKHYIKSSLNIQMLCTIVLLIDMC